MKELVEKLVAAAHAAGAEGIWLVRGAQKTGVMFTFDEQDIQFLELGQPAELVVVCRFPVGDDAEPGIEGR